MTKATFLVLLAGLSVPAFAAGSHRLEDPDGGGLPPLHAAAVDGDLDLVKLLLDRGAPVNGADSEGKTALIDAAEQSSDRASEMARVVFLLLERGAAPSARDDAGRTALHAAAAKGNVAVAKLLLDHGAKPDARDANGMTPLMWAAMGDDGNEIVKLLLNRGARVDAANKNQQTPLFLARANDRIATESTLRYFGAR